MSTYPPTMCGLATFTSSLRDALAAVRGSSEQLDVFAVLEGAADGIRRPEVVGTLDPADPFTVRNAAAAMSRYDVVILQHEYGIWGPNMGLPVVDLVNRLDAPLLTTLHTVLPSPTELQTRIVEALSSKSAYTIVPTRVAGELLSIRYSVEPRRVEVIPHGTDPYLRSVAALREQYRVSGRRLLTWGLIGPGKGLEWAIRAVALARRSYPDIVYTIAGKTHPKVAELHGESYRRSLEALVASLDLDRNVRFVDEYISPALLRNLLAEAAVVVLPYDSSEQVVSGVLVEAIAANVPLIATAFPHAVELADMGAVQVVPHRDADAIAQSIEELLGSQTTAEQMISAQRALAPDLDWGSVAASYERLMERVVAGTLQLNPVPPASGVPASTRPHR